MKFELSKEAKEALSALNPDFVYVPMSAKDIADIEIALEFDMPKPTNEICHVDVLTGELMPSYPTEEELASIGCRMVDKCVEVK